MAAGVFYWLLNRFAPHKDSVMDHPETGEEIIAANDAKNVEAAKGRKSSIFSKVFSV